MSSKPVRRATYRLQLRPVFGFDAAGSIADYLASLGVSHVYCSPYLQAMPGSSHGYDVIDHRQISRDLGGAEAHSRFCCALSEQGLTQLLDIVPNHMAVGPLNPAWWDVLENGPASRFAAFFDVDWSPPEERLRDKILIPILGDHSGRVIEAGEIQVVREGGRFSIRYFDHRVPVAPRSLADPLALAAERTASPQLAYFADAIAELPLPTVTDRTSLERRHRDRHVLFELLGRFLAENPSEAHELDVVLEELSRDADRLDDFLGRQNCRLAYWRASSRDLGYRRFFDINTLAAIRVEDDAVFYETHALPLSLLAQGLVDGLRIDHPDGLRDPEAYLERLRSAHPDAWIVVEKILEPDEQLRDTWPVDGTTGYDFMNVVNRLFVEPRAQNALTQFYVAFTGDAKSYQDHLLAAKHEVMRELLGSDVNRLTALFLGVCESRRRYRDFTRHEAHDVLLEVAASFPVYRSYFRTGDEERNSDDFKWVHAAIEKARDRRPDLDGELFDFFGKILARTVVGDLESELCARFQQFTGPAMAKGAEDTSFYRYLRFVALNEVGGAPDHFGGSVEEFHAFASHIALHWPETLLTTSTHDTKRSEDVRARLWTLSECPEHFCRLVSTWSEMLGRFRGGNAPDRLTEYLFYQTLVGAFPISAERMNAYLLKAVREAKLCTSWTRPNEAYEQELASFAKAALGDAHFIHALSQFLAPLVHAGRVNSLAQALLKLTAPGVPDIYQGTELWDLSLVDPDNRRPVDFVRRRDFLRSIDRMDAKSVLERIDDGFPKLYVIARALAVRQRHPEAFSRGSSYQPIYATGERQRHLIAFERNVTTITLVPRFNLSLDGSWGDTVVELPPGTHVDVFTGNRLSGGTQELKKVFRDFPVALLEREGDCI